MKSVHPMLDALRSGNEKEILKYSDLLIPTVDIEDVVKNMPQYVEELDISEQREPEENGLKSLLEFFKLDYKEHVSEIALLKDEYPDIDNVSLVRKLIAEVDASKVSLKSVQKKEQKPKTNVVPYGKWSKLDHDDLRYIRSQSNTESEMHSNLVKAGLIASLD